MMPMIFRIVCHCVLNAVTTGDGAPRRFPRWRHPAAGAGARKARPRDHEPEQERGAPAPARDRIGGQESRDRRADRRTQQHAADRAERREAADQIGLFAPLLLRAAAVPKVRWRRIHDLDVLLARARSARRPRAGRQLRAVRRGRRHAAGFGGRRGDHGIPAADAIASWAGAPRFLFGLVIGVVVLYVRRRLPPDAAIVGIAEARHSAGW